MNTPDIQQKKSHERWNDKYRYNGSASFSSEPSRWLTDHRELIVLLSPGVALDVACGSGRNSRVLADLGFAVDAIDVSDVVIFWLADTVRDKGLDIRPIWADVTRYQFPPSTYDVAVNMNCLERSIFSQLAQTLRPGGLLFVEAFTSAQTTQLGKAMNPAYTLNPGELRAAFPELQLIDYREGPVLGGGTSHRNEVAQIVARRPPQ